MMAQKSNDKKKPAFDFSTLPKALTQEIAKTASKAGVEAYEAMYEKYKAEQKDRKLRNTKLLLRNYRMLDDYNKNAIYDIAKLCANGIDGLLDIIGADPEHKVESIEDGVIKTRIIMEHVDTMLDCYKQRCQASNKPEVNRRWRVLWMLYIGPDRYGPQEIADIENVSYSTVYTDIDTACEELSTLFFGIDVLELWK